MNWKIYDSPEQLIRTISDQLLVLSRTGKAVHISLSGGSTPKRWFQALAQPEYINTINWQNLHFWWGDERCVSPESDASNFGTAFDLLFRYIAIPRSHIHRIHGEETPAIEAERYAAELDEFLEKNGDGIPVFDWMILGMGTDGHTASLFPGAVDFGDTNFTTVAYHPESGQARISLTAAVLCAARRLSYLVPGRNKLELLQKIYTEDDETVLLPAARIQSTSGETEWYLDQPLQHKKTTEGI